MAPHLLLALALSTLIGVSLGLLGGGGSILAVPVLVYVARQRDAIQKALEAALQGVRLLPVPSSMAPIDWPLQPIMTLLMALSILSQQQGLYHLDISKLALSVTTH